MPFNFRRKPLQVGVLKVLVLDFRPAAIPQEWGNTDRLIQEYIEAMIQASHKILVYKIVDKLVVQKYPLLADSRQ